MFEYKPVERPYPGLRPFEPWETGIFFGRDQYVDRLQDILRREHFLTVTGPSGSGKSSLVLAGLLPALPLGAIGTGSDWKLARMRPGDKPLSSLSSALCGEYAFQAELAAASGTTASPENFAVARVEAELRRGALGLVELVTDLRRFAAEPAFNLLVLVDQFEEIFTYAEAGNRQADEADALVNLLLTASNTPATNIFVILTMRTDFLGACTRFLDLPSAINRSLFLTPRLNRDQLAEAIAGPASLFGMQLAPDWVVEYVNAGQNDPDQLPVLQHALARRWDEAQANGPRSAQASFAAVGDLGKALSEHADAVYQSLNHEQRLNAQWLFRAITEQRSAQAGGQTVRRPQSLAKIADWSDRPWQAFLPVLSAFADTKVSFLSYQGQPGEPAKAEATVIDISHEAVMRQWQTLKSWIASESRAAQAFSEWRERANNKNQGGGSYLTGADLNRAELWLTQGLDFAAPSTDSPHPNSAPTDKWASRYVAEDENKLLADTRRFIQNSRKAARFLQRLLSFAAGTVVIACFVAAGFGYNSYQKSLASEAKTLWFSIHKDSNLTGRDADFLLKVASEKEATRLRFLSEIFDDKTIAELFNEHHSLLMRTGIKSKLKLRNTFLAQILDAETKTESPQTIASAVALLDLDGQQTNNDINNLLKNSNILLNAISTIKFEDYYSASTINKNGLISFNKGLEVLASKMTDIQVSEVIARYLDIVQNTSDFHKLNILGDGLDGLMSKLNNAQVDAELVHYLEVVLKTTEDDQLRALSLGLGKLVNKLNENQAEAVLVHYLKVSQQHDSPYLLEALGQGLGELAGKLSDARATAVLADYLAAVLKTSDDEKLKILCQDLSSLANKLSDVQLTKIITHYLDVVLKTVAPYKLQSLGPGLGYLSGKLDNTQATVILNQYLETLKEADDDQLEALGQGLVAVADMLTDTQATAIITYYLEVYGSLSPLRPKLVILKSKLNDGQKAEVIRRYLKVVQETEDPYELESLRIDLDELAVKLTNEQVVSILVHYLDVMDNIEQFRAADFALELRELTSKMTDKQAEAVLPYYLKVAHKTVDPGNLYILSEALGPLARKLTDNQVTAMFDHYLDVMQKTAANYPSDQRYPFGLPFRTTDMRNAIGELASTLTKAQAAVVLPHYIKALEATKTPGELFDLGEGLGTLANELTESQVVAVVAHYIKLLQQYSSTDRFVQLIQDLNSLAGKLSATQVNLVLANYLEHIKETSTPDDFVTLMHLLNSLPGKLSENQVNIVLTHFLTIVEQTKHPQQIMVLAKNLNVLPRNLSKAQIDGMLTHYLQDVLLGSYSEVDMDIYVEGLDAVLGNVTDAKTTLVAAFLKNSQPIELSVLAQSLGSLSGKLSETQEAAVIAHYLEVMKKAMYIPDYQKGLVKGLGSLMSKLSDTQTVSGLISYLNVFQEPVDIHQIYQWNQGFFVMAEKWSTTQANAVMPVLINALNQPQFIQNGASISETLNLIIPKLTMNDTSVRQWLHLCNDNPFIDRDAVAEVIRKYYPAAPKAEAGIWAFLQWANGRFGVDRPDPEQAPLIASELFGLPMLVLILGGIALHTLSGRQLVVAQLAKLESPKDRRGLGLRLKGYDLAAVKTHWGILGADERVIEQRYLWMDLLFPLAYGGAFGWALLQASDYLSDPVPTVWLRGLIGLTVLADWTENEIQLLQLRRWDAGKPLQARRIALASVATQIKLLSAATLTCILAYFCLRLLVY